MEKGSFVDLNVIWKQRCELRSKGFKLLAEGDKLWVEAILKKYGDIKIEWIKRQSSGQPLTAERDCNCKLETGELFEWR